MSNHDHEKGPRFILLDRDGTLNVDIRYLSDPNDLRLETNAAQGLRALAGQGFRFAILTNQSGVARGYFSMARLKEIHARLTAMLADEGAVIEGCFCCPHGPHDGCGCRKPRSGLAKRAAAALGFELKRAWMIGDKAADVSLGKTVGSRTVLVRTGEGAKTEADGACAPDIIADDLLDAARKIKAFEAA